MLRLLMVGVSLSRHKASTANRITEVDGEASGSKEMAEDLDALQIECMTVTLP